MPHCPECLQEQVAELARCPLDRAFYVERRCPKCQTELRVRERYCPHCGTSAEGVTEQVIADLPRSATWRRIVALGVDLLVLFIAIMGIRNFPASLGAWTLYLVLFRSQGRQTLGQTLTGITTLGLDKRPPTLKMGIKRALITLSVLFEFMGGRWRSWSGTDDYLASTGS